MPCQDCSDNVPLASGATGANGAQGEFGGNSLSWIYSTGSEESTKFRTNGATTLLSAVTQFNVHTTNEDSVVVTTWLTNIASGDIIRVFQENDSSIFGIYTVGSPSTVSSERLFPVTLIASNGSLTNSSSYVISHHKVGASGTDGEALIGVDYSDNTTTSVSFATIKSYTIPANTFSQDEDSVVLDMNILANITDASHTGQWRVQMDDGSNPAVAIHTQTSFLQSTMPYHTARLVITRVGANSVSMEMIYNIYTHDGFSYANGTGYNAIPHVVINKNLSTLDFTNAITLEIDASISNAASEVKTSFSKLIKSIKA